MGSAAGFVLAGGRSSRMGRDKALLPFAGKSLLEHALSGLRHACIPAAIVGDRPDLAAYAAIIPDQEAGRGPLHGVCRALASTEAKYAVFLSVDTPLLPPALLSHLLQHARLTGNLVTLPAINGFPQTFPCVLRRAALPMLKRELHAGRAGTVAAFRTAAAEAGQHASILSLELLVQTGQLVHAAGIPPAFWLLNLNTRDDLAFARRWIPAPIA